MLHELSHGKMENEFRNISPADPDIVVCVQNNSILVKQNMDGSFSLPRYADVCQWANKDGWTSWKAETFRYVFRMQDVNYFLWMGQAGECPDPAYYYENARQFRNPQSLDVCFAAMTAWHLYVWYRSNQFCGCCATPTVHDQAERMLRCPKCGNMIFPRISPAVIIAVTDGDRLLLSKYAGRNTTRYALIAGYTEIGETLEQTVHREVMEEVGLRVKNLRYYKSQPWGVDGNVLAGFFCDLDGDDAIHLDRRELSLAEWHERHTLPQTQDGISMTQEMILLFAKGGEPRT